MLCGYLSRVPIPDPHFDTMRDQKTLVQQIPNILRACVDALWAEKPWADIRTLISLAQGFYEACWPSDSELLQLTCMDIDAIDSLALRDVPVNRIAASSVGECLLWCVGVEVWNSKQRQFGAARRGSRA